jgi:hypothetical protein
VEAGLRKINASTGLREVNRKGVNNVRKGYSSAG